MQIIFIFLLFGISISYGGDGVNKKLLGGIIGNHNQSTLNLSAGGNVNVNSPTTHNHHYGSPASSCQMMSPSSISSHSSSGVKSLLEIEGVKCFIDCYFLEITQSNIHSLSQIAQTEKESFKSYTGGILIKKVDSGEVLSNLLENFNSIKYFFLEPFDDQQEGALLSSLGRSFQYMKNIEELSLQNCSITDEDFTSLIRSEAMGNLTKDLLTLDITGTSITESMLYIIRAYFQESNIHIKYSFNQRPGSITPSVFPIDTQSLIIPHFAVNHEDIYRQFIKGTLIFNFTERPLEFPFYVFKDTLEGEFNLESLYYQEKNICVYIRDSLKIKLGYPKASDIENDARVTIWISPHFLSEGKPSLIPQELNWTSGIGIFLTWQNHSPFYCNTNLRLGDPSILRFMDSFWGDQLSVQHSIAFKASQYFSLRF